ncbi:variant erythrocyte surface antigen-1 family protein [Babesia caballi]|uniref:Variant erythrocyte surface antigen-1 family protein n=1 Tax=Babesia caballi TaxID=5871 RepID=A0AAV4LVG8_BABCB|nr:variant erythrocyte surface antigen-1 family protein [Babesia caballi]
MPTGFGNLVDAIKGKVEQGFDKKIGHSGMKNNGKLNTVFTALKGIIVKFQHEHDTHNVDGDTENVQNYLDAVNTKLLDDGSTNFKDLNDKLKMLFDDLKSKADDQSTPLDASSLTSHIGNVTTYADKVKSDIGNIKAQDKFKNYANAAVFTAVRDAATAFIAELQTKAYTSYYDKADWSNVSGRSEIEKTCAQIFLGCLPLYYQALTYIYWRCHEKGGGWRNLTLAGGDLRSYFDSQGLLSIFVESSRTGAHIADSALKKFSEFTQGMREASSSPFTYYTFTKELHKKVKENGGELPKTCPLSALYHGASCYFQCQQIKVADKAFNTPKTIREMLYFLAALQFSPQYDAFDSYVTEYFKAVTGSQSGDDSDLKLQVADSGISTEATVKSGGNTLSAADIKDYLTETSMYSMSALGILQGAGASMKAEEPWLHELFCNSQFHLSYSSGPAIFHTLAKYTYALQFQLSFLFSMCANNGMKCGWQECTYGKDIKGSGNSLQSHICTGFKCQQENCDHKSSGNCKHNDYGDNDSCGQSGSPSPLQAFLTGALPSFRLSTSSTPKHMSDHPQGALCHVPMGFQANHLRSIGNGARVYLVLKSICGNFSSPLRQLCEKLGCLTKRTPRSLGDLFGFTWHLKGQLFPKGNQGNITDAEWLKVLIQYTPFSNNLIKDHGDKLKTFVGSNHTSHGNSPNDLTALHSYRCNQQQQTCGPYLSPLTISNGATFGKPAPYASTYLSWMVYLTDDLQTGLQELLDEFKNIDCKASGCRKAASGTQACSTPHQPGTHGTNTDACSCDSVLHCGGVLPLLYRHGFQFMDAKDLKDNSKSCTKFSTQLSNVLAEGAPLAKLLESIDEFLYLFRFYFFYNQSAFWTVYICLILYTLFFLLDTLHLRSHLKLTSHTLPPLALLTSGQPLPITKLTYITQ